MVRGSSVGPSPSRRAPHHDKLICHGEAHPAATEELRGASNHGSEKGLQPGEARVAGKAAQLIGRQQAPRPPNLSKAVPGKNATESLLRTGRPLRCLRPLARPLSLQASGAFRLVGWSAGRSAAHAAWAGLGQGATGLNGHHAGGAGKAYRLRQHATELLLRPGGSLLPPKGGLAMTFGVRGGLAMTPGQARSRLGAGRIPARPRRGGAFRGHCVPANSMVCPRCMHGGASIRSGRVWQGPRPWVGSASTSGRVGLDLG